MKSATVPGLRYRDAPAAIDWLCKAFGFDVFMRVPEEGKIVVHARLVLEDNMIMIASARREGAIEALLVTPKDAGGATQLNLLYVDDPDAIYQKTLAANAIIIEPIDDFEFGGRMFSCQDPEEYVWVFSSHDHWGYQ